MRAVAAFGVLAFGVGGCTFDRHGIALVDALAPPSDGASVELNVTDGPADLEQPRDTGEAPFLPDGPKPTPDGPKPTPDGPPTPDLKPTPDGPPKPDMLGCPPGYSKSSVGCHRIVNTPTDWLTAEKDCEKDGVGAHLVVVSSTAENNALPDYAWIGISERVTAGTYLLVTGGPQSFTAYASGEPVSGGAACIVTRPDGWHDDNCPELKSYICEYDGVPANPASY